MILAFSHSTFPLSEGGNFAFLLALPAADLKHVDGDGGADLLLSQLHAVVENFEELL